MALSELSPVLLFFFDLSVVLLDVAPNEDKADVPDIERGNKVLGAVEASVAIESKLLHFVMMHRRNSL